MLRNQSFTGQVSNDFFDWCERKGIPVQSKHNQHRHLKQNNHIQTQIDIGKGSVVYVNNRYFNNSNQYQLANPDRLDVYS